MAQRSQANERCAQAAAKTAKNKIFITPGFEGAISALGLKGKRHVGRQQGEQAERISREVPWEEGRAERGSEVETKDRMAALRKTSPAGRK